MRIIGVDPGASGGMAELEIDATGSRKVTRTEKLPWVKTGKKPDLDVQAVADFITAGGKPDLVVFEKVGYRPKFGRGAKGGGEGVEAAIGIGSAFGDIQLALGYGQLIGMAKILKLAYEEVPPASWHPKLLGKLNHAKGDSHAARKKRTKQATAAWCKRFYPDAPVTPGKCRTPQDGLTDSVALAHYGAVFVFQAKSTVEPTAPVLPPENFTDTPLEETFPLVESSPT